MHVFWTQPPFTKFHCKEICWWAQVIKKWKLFQYDKKQQAILFYTKLSSNELFECNCEACFRDGVNRHKCPKGNFLSRRSHVFGIWDMIMCNNPFQLEGKNYVCAHHIEWCMQKFYNGPRPCENGQDLASLYETETSCSEKIVEISIESANEIANIGKVLDCMNLFQVKIFLRDHRWHTNI